MAISKRILKSGLRFRYEFKNKGKRYQSKSIYKTREEAEEAQLLHRNRVHGATLYDLFQLRLEEMKLYDKSKDYYAESKRYFSKAEKFWGAHLRPTEVTKEKAYTLVMSEARRLKETGKGIFKANSMIRVLKSFFNWVIDIRDIDMKNPFKKMTLFAENPKRKYIPSDNEINLVREQLKGLEILLFDFVDQTGCRIMEAINLQAEDVNEKTVTLYTRKAKNSNLTPRVIPRPDCLKDEHIPNSGRVFNKWNSWPHTLVSIIKDLVEKGQCKKRWNWHNLRHRRASIWGNDPNIPIFEISQRLGHNNTSTTMRYLQRLGIFKI